MTRDDVLFITKGDMYAADFVETFVKTCHTVDDVVDRDKPVARDVLALTLLEYTEALLVNPWARQHQLTLFPLIVAGAVAWCDSNEWTNPEEAKVLKGIYHEVVWWVAYLCGGLTHMAEVTKRFREYDT